MGAPLGNQNAVGNKGGRGNPSIYNPDYHPRKAKEFALLGLTNKQIANAFDIEERTFDNWKREHIELLSALKDGKEIADGKVAKSLYLRANGYKHKAVKMFYDKERGEVIKEEYIEHYPPDPTSMIFWLKNRQPDLWRDRHQLELINPKEKLAEILGCSVEELPNVTGETTIDISGGDEESK